MSGKKILILGGTSFIGPPMIDAAIARGHTVTMFNRGRTNPHVHPDVERIIGDRDQDEDLAKLSGRKWDAVIDTCGYVSRIVDKSARRLADCADHYLFVSSISVYADHSQPWQDEAAPVAVLDDPTVEEVTVETYGALKALCEQAVERAMSGRATIIRPGLIVGPGDTTDRFTYWPVRLARGGDVLAPGTGEEPVQLIDARDLANWTIILIERNVMGIYNAVGPAERMTMRELLETSRHAVESDATLVWTEWPLLEKHQVKPWQELPCWLPATGEHRGMMQHSNRRAVAEGLTFRTLIETARDTLEWFRTLPSERQRQMSAGMTANRERDLLAARHVASG